MNGSYMQLKQAVNFGNPFSGLAKDKKLTKEELIRAIRFVIAAEYEAVQLYNQLAESIDDKNAQKVLNDIADEEKVHAGEFLGLLKTLAPDESKFYTEGEEEVKELITKEKTMKGSFAKLKLAREMLTAEITVKGKDKNSIVKNLGAITRMIAEGSLDGEDSNEWGSYSFNLEK